MSKKVWSKVFFRFASGFHVSRLA